MSEDFSGSIFVRTSPRLHEAVSRRAQREGVSMSQWVAEVLAAKIGGEEPRSEVGSARADATRTAAAIWLGNVPARGPSEVVAARSLLSRLEDTPGLDRFLEAGRHLGELHAEYSLAERLGVPRSVLMHLTNQIQSAHIKFEQSKPEHMPLGFENKSWGSILELVAQLEELAALKVTEDP